MSSRNLIKAAGLVLFVPCVVAGSLPLLAAHTDLLNHLGNFEASFGTTEVLAVYQTASGTSASVHPIVWVPAAIGELILIGIQIISPARKSRYRLTIN